MAADEKDEPPSADTVVLKVVPLKGGFLVRIGAVYLSLDRQVTEELMYLLADVLDPLGLASGESN
jgi:hypothetical protein